MKITIIGILSLIVTAIFMKPSPKADQNIENIKLSRSWTSQEVLEKTQLYKEVNILEDTFNAREATIRQQND